MAGGGGRWQLAAVGYDDLGLGHAGELALGFDLAHDVHPFHHLAEHHVAPVQLLGQPLFAISHAHVIFFKKKHHTSACMCSRKKKDITHMQDGIEICLRLLLPVFVYGGDEELGAI